MKKTYCLIFLICSLRAMAQPSSESLDVETLLQKAYTHFYTNQDSAYYYFNKIKTHYKNENQWEHAIASLISINRVASYNYNLNKMKSSLNELDSIWVNHEDYIQALPNHLVYKNSILYDKGVYYFETQSYAQSQKAFQDIITSLDSLPDTLHIKETSDLLSGAFNFIAKINSEAGRYNVAEQYYQKNIRFILNNKPEDKTSLYINYGLLGDLYSRTKAYKKANLLFKEALNYNLENKGNNNTIISLSQILANNYIALKQPDSANYYMQVLKNHLPVKHPLENTYYNAKAKLYLDQQNSSLALKAYQKALDLTQEKWNNQPHPEVAEYHHKIGLLHYNNNNLEKSILNYNLAIATLNQNNSQLQSNQPLLVKVLKDKAIALNQVATKEAYTNTTKTVQLAITALDSLKPTFKSEADKLLLIEDAFPLFEAGIEAAYQQYQLTNDPAFIEHAFFYSEKSKNTLLFEALLSAKATKFSMIPNELLENEKQLKSEISRLEKNIISGKQNNNHALKDKLFELKKKHWNIIKTIETNHKDYYNLKYNTQVSRLNAFQETLQEEDLAITYFYGNHALYCISLNQNSASIHKVKMSEALNNKIVSAYKNLSSPQSQVSVLATATHELYTLLVLPAIKPYKKAQRLIVIPDGLLNYLPFGSFNTQKDGLNYLITHKTIGYANSATLLMQLGETSISNRNLLALAPDFKTSNNKTLLPLPNNKKEANVILNYFNGKSLIGAQATLNHFLQENQEHGIIHLATHAVTNDKHPELSYLAFEPDTNEENLLYVSDLYNLELRTELVTLSACESGIGELKRGEGFLSLARGFYFSGTKSIASTLWKINDGATAKIMDGFYAYLSQGHPKHVALQKAKVNFIADNKQNALVHPYYWSGFIVSGNLSAINETQTHYVWGLIAFLGLVAFGITFLKTKP
ncbi:hypothetical protein IA57_08490 [Mangrovimonas yunxiaonensis]|uniref:CHAT domain-containing protein n=2 Tax=Mangrovimonas yunxiaonensis TaxID=1197477 RepID=A0A084TIH3_9FLAO|nr:CHAT domain-containing tetratricopeptide repeat protein [Mangrovimonas yunxiaonensis]KFB00509.1 hypothetical protein IA57_08490 [Mangrovimonas yunxiaonensis]